MRGIKVLIWRGLLLQVRAQNISHTFRGREGHCGGGAHNNKLTRPQGYSLNLQPSGGTINNAQYGTMTVFFFSNVLCLTHQKILAFEALDLLPLDNEPHTLLTGPSI